MAVLTNQVSPDFLIRGASQHLPHAYQFMVNARLITQPCFQLKANSVPGGFMVNDTMIRTKRVRADNGTLVPCLANDIAIPALKVK
jgi:hypothetical protein